MKCIRCGADSKFRERTGKMCPRCKGAFAFEPREGDRFTDQGFQNAIDAVSASGRLRWGVEHLHYEICRRWNFRRRNQWFFGLAAILGVAIFFPGWTKVLALAGALGCTLWLYRRARRPERVPARDFDVLWRRWTQVHGQPKGVIIRQPAASPASTVSAKEADLGDYSFDRAVICDRARTADLLLANNFHFEHNCAVLSIDGYPPGPFAMVRAMLKRNPRLQVYALHDATPAGCRMALKLARDRDWFASPLRITDVGLRPGHAKRHAPLWSPRAALVGASDGITATEAEWLSRNALELAAFRPEYILKQVFGAMTRRKDKNDSGGDGGGDSGVGSSGEGSVTSDTAAFSGEGGESGGGGADDSFG